MPAGGAAAARGGRCHGDVVINARGADRPVRQLVLAVDVVSYRDENGLQVRDRSARVVASPVWSAICWRIVALAAPNPIV